MYLMIMSGFMKCSKTWKENDGKQKISLFSTRGKLRKMVHTQKQYMHSKFLDFMTSLHNADIDIMLELKIKSIGHKNV